MTPIYSLFLGVCALTFAYFVCMEQNQCYAMDSQAYSTMYYNTENVTKHFYWLSLAGMLILGATAIVY